MGEGLKSQHKDAVRNLEEHFHDRLDHPGVRWDTLLVEEEHPSKHVEDIEKEFEGEVDIALVNGTEAYVLEVKTTENGSGKARQQVQRAENFFSSEGYEVFSAYHVDERNQHMDSSDLSKEIHDVFGGVFTREDLREIIEYQNTWGSFGYVKSELSEVLEPEDTTMIFQEHHSPYNLELLEDRAVLTDIGAEEYGFTDEYMRKIADEDQEVLMLSWKAYSQHINQQ